MFNLQMLFMSFFRHHAESGKLGKGGGMEWMDGRNFSPVFYMISDPLGPLPPPKKEKQMGDARAKREGSETAQGLAQTLKSLALAS